MNVIASLLYSDLPYICSGLEKLAMTALAAKKKHLQRVQLMKAQTHQNADMMQQRHEKDRADEVHTQTVEARQQHLKAERLAREAGVEVRTTYTSSLPSHGLLTACLSCSLPSPPLPPPPVFRVGGSHLPPMSTVLISKPPFPVLTEPVLSSTVSGS